jgi:hypothetical protein
MAIDRNYVSEMDKFLKELDQKPESHSDSRAAEEKKYQRINELRDNPNAKDDSEKIWRGF